MSVIRKVLVSFALLLGACNRDDLELAEALAVAEATAAESEGRRVSKLDKDGDDAISRTELEDNELAPLFDEFDADGNELLSRDEIIAVRYARSTGKRADDPAVRAVKLLAKLDRDQDGTVSFAETVGHRLLEDFAHVDVNDDGKLSAAELAAYKMERRKQRAAKPQAHG